MEIFLKRSIYLSLTLFVRHLKKDCWLYDIREIMFKHNYYIFIKTQVIRHVLKCGTESPKAKFL